MPQVDIVTYTSQFFWFIIIFLSFYIAVVRSILPTISKTLKFRKKRLNIYSNQIKDLISEQNKTSENYETLVYNILNLNRIVVLKITEVTTTWLTNKIQETNQKTFAILNQKYLKSVSSIISKTYSIKRCIV